MSLCSKCQYDLEQDLSPDSSIEDQPISICPRCNTTNISFSMDYQNAELCASGNCFSCKSIMRSGSGSCNDTAKLPKSGLWSKLLAAMRDFSGVSGKKRVDPLMTKSTGE